MPQIIHDAQQWQQQMCDMARNLHQRNALAASIKSPEKTPKHSVLFYISPSLFDNRRLKQKRTKWAAECLQQRQQELQQPMSYRQTKANKKTDHTMGGRTAQEPAVTINLLSDDEEEQCASSGISNDMGEKQQQQHNSSSSHAFMPGPPPLAPIQGIQLQPAVNGQPLQHFLVYPGNIPGLQLLNASNIRLIPLSHLSLDAVQQQSLELQKQKGGDKQPSQQPKQQLQQQHHHINQSQKVSQISPSAQQSQSQKLQQSKAPTQGKRKRKSHQPKRHSQPIIVNNESIVLTDDDSDSEAFPPHTTQLPQRQQAQVRAKPAIAPSSPPPLTPTPPVTAIAVPTIVHASAAKHANKEPVTPAASPTRIAQVDEEVTVSLVPRSSTGSCSTKTANSKLFPMQPDETTVHTVIANRIYELSLAKLREGLGIDCEQNGQVKASPTRRKGKSNGPLSSGSGRAASPQEPISLKLSSDLSISLISDDDDEDEDGMQQRQPFKLQLPAHLAVQQVHLPAATAADTGQLPRRRKLG